MSSKVAIVDYGLCNLDSVRRAFEELGAQPYVTDDPEALKQADRIVLPGVGAFPEAMRNLRSKGLDDALTAEVIHGGAPFLGICLGMQLATTRGDEVEDTPGLGWFDATVTRFEAQGGERVPHIGWNEVERSDSATLFAGIPVEADFYFVHSFCVTVAAPSDIAATTPYCGGFISALERDQVFAVQFHPEKSQRHGFRVLENFLAV